jgi:hypothetical protein
VTRSQRRIRARKAGQLAAENRTYAAGVNLAENPNRGKRHVARLAYMDGFVAELARAERKAYQPLTVATRFRTVDGRRYPDRRDANGSPAASSHSSYTV